MIKITKSLNFKLIVSLAIVLGLLMTVYTGYQVREVRKRVEADLTAKGFALTKSAARGLGAMMENDIRNGVITEAALFDRNYTMFQDDADPKKKKYHSAFDTYTDKHWQKYVDSFLVDEDVVFAIPVAYSGNDATEGYLPTHNTKYQDRSKRIFNDETGAGAARTENERKHVYKRDTGETMWDMSYPVFVNGKHWGGYRVAISIVRAEAKIAESRQNIIMIMAGIVIVMMGLLYLISRIVIGNPLKRVLLATENLASGQGDLTQRLPENTEDELGMLARYFNKFISQIHDMVQNVVLSINQVTSTSDRLSENANEVAKAGQHVADSITTLVEGNNVQENEVIKTGEIIHQFSDAITQIANGASEQVENVNQTSLYIGQMAESINSVAANAQGVSEAAQQASEVATKGENAVDRTVSGMEKIKTSVFESAVKIRELGEQSQKIGEIIQVIDDIAEQTNLLALNAAIEAARAGEHGKGFAVVADEVRKLAERSSKATKEIADLINNIRKDTEIAVKAMEHGTKEVEEGVELAHDAGAALAEIMQVVGKTYEQIQSISAAASEMADSSSSVVMAIDNVAAITQQNTASTQEMAMGSDKATSAISTIADLTKKNSEAAESMSVAVEEMAASTEDIAAAAESLNKMSHQLKQLVEGFRI
jgi:methyl-accepting chemotaxis protein